MKQLNMTLAKHNDLKAQYGGKVTGIHKELATFGFDISKDYSVGMDEGTGDFIFMQAEPKPTKSKPKNAFKPDGKK